MTVSFKAARRNKIIDTAQKLFVTNGFKSTSMEAIAAAADLSKVTLYGYFKDKDVVFTAVAERMAQRLKEAVSDGLNSKGTTAERVAAALIAKHEIVFEVVRSSAFASELFATSNHLAKATFNQTDAEIEVLIGACLTSADRSARDAKSLAHLLFGASQGIANHAASLRQAKVDIAKLVSALVP